MGEGRTFSQLERWHHLWDRRVNASLRSRDWKLLRGLGFNEDRTSFQIEVQHRYSRSVPSFAMSDKQLREIISTVFQDKDRAKAGRWLRMAYLYYRMGIPGDEVAAEMGCTRDAVMSMLENVMRHFRAKTKMGSHRKGCRRIRRPLSVHPSVIRRAEIRRILGFTKTNPYVFVEKPKPVAKSR